MVQHCIHMIREYFDAANDMLIPSDAHHPPNTWTVRYSTRTDIFLNKDRAYRYANELSLKHSVPIVELNHYVHNSNLMK